MMRRTYQGLSWWKAGVPLLLLGGLLVLEPQAPLSPGGHRVILLVVALLLYGIAARWLRHNRGALINEAYERERKERVYKSMPQGRELAMSDYEPWEDAKRPLSTGEGGG